MLDCLIFGCKWEGENEIFTDFNDFKHCCGENSSCSVFTSGVISPPLSKFAHPLQEVVVHLTRRLSSDEEDARFSRRPDLTLALREKNQTWENLPGKKSIDGSVRTIGS